MIGHAALLGCLAVASAYDDFRVGVPNGARLSAQGHGAWFGDDNPFGLDWAMFDYTWSLELCASDSDMDGQHNGFELGDECCCWDAKTAWALAVAPSFRGGETRTSHSESYAKHGIEDLPRGDLLSHPGDPTSCWA
ncbi:ABC transporter [Aureococcus anophagefferens]|uniref:ABC transporter n=1 Tax=Aureococcus anophagefferens TaxID=44056 RepID=A0ABR1FMU4_AURAN